MKQTAFLFALVLVPSAYSYCEVFCTRLSGNSPSQSGSFTKSATFLSAANSDNVQQASETFLSPNDKSRRAFFQSIASLSSAACFTSPGDSLAAAAPEKPYGSSPDRPVAILGAGGKTGMEVAQALANEGLYSVTMTRSGRDPFTVVKPKPEVQQYIQHYETGVNVVERESLHQALKDVKASAIIYCASASRQGGNAFQVDDEGVGYAAEAAKDMNARLVLVSAVAVDRPNSKSYQVTNALGGSFQGIMDAKLQGENKVRSILSRKKDYVIIRPGVLLNGKTKNGPLDMEVNQGDTIGGGLSRDELAGVIVGGLISGKTGVTVEVYRRSTATPLQLAFTIPSGNEATSMSWEGLFDSAKPDGQL